MRDKSDNTSYKEILKSTNIIASASIINIIFRIIRNKVLAVLVGPAGIGLMGIYDSIMRTASTVAGMGLSGSGVRQIAESQVSGDCQVIASTRFSLRWVTLIFSTLGAFIFFMLRHDISQLTFGNDNHTTAIGILSLGVFFSVIAFSQIAFLNGLRLIKDLARINIIGSFFSTFVAIILIYIFRENGIATYIALGTFMMFLVSIYYSRKVPKIATAVSVREIKKQINSLLRLGSVFMLTGFMNVGTVYLVRILITRKLGIEETGYFQAAWGVAMLYTGFVLDAMGKDYYPRLTALSNDHRAMNQMVNEQAEIAFLLAGPIILAMLTFTPLITYLLYSSDFITTNPILRWLLLGTIFKITSWSVGFVILAKGRGTFFFFTELLWNCLYLFGIWWGMTYVGLISTGISFFIAYLLHTIIVYFVVVYLSGFSPLSRNVYMILILAIASFIILFLSNISSLGSYLVGSIFTMAFSFYSIKTLYNTIGPSKIKSFFYKIKMHLYWR